MNRMIRCAHCGRRILSNPRVKEQRYCSRKACQRARKTLWQRVKMATDPDYQLNQRDCQKDWNKRNPDYWRLYRSRNPGYRTRNRLLQKHRDRRRRDLAKMDAFGGISPIQPGSYYLIPARRDLAKMDALSQKVYLIPTWYTDLAKKDSIDSLTTFP
jgi:DNA-directed RNA polymerase subunit RPC12/RpoP